MNDDLLRLLEESPSADRGPSIGASLPVVPCVQPASPSVEDPAAEPPCGDELQAEVPTDCPPAPSTQNETDSDGGYDEMARPAEAEPPAADAQPENPLADRVPVASEYHLLTVNLEKSFQKAAVRIPVLQGVTLGIHRGEFLAVVGQSGSGKSTLLHLLGTLDSPDNGAIYFDGRRIDDLPGNCRDTLRNKHFGMIFQMYHLLPELTTLENVLTPLMIGQSIRGFFRRRREFRAAASELLDTVGLGHRLNHKPRELSGGEMQRAAIARALVANPQLLLADEPTGNLDHASGREILEILASLNQRQNLTIVMVTHDPAIAARAHRIVRLIDGRVEEV